MARLSDLPDPYAIVVMLPGVAPSISPTTCTVNGRIARMIAWLLDHRPQIEAMRGSVVFNFGDRGFQAELRETFPYQNVLSSLSPGARVVSVTENIPDPEEPDVETNEPKP